MFVYFIYLFSVIAVHKGDLQEVMTWGNTMTCHFVITLNYKNKLQSENHLSSKETAYIAANQAIPVKQAKKRGMLFWFVAFQKYVVISPSTKFLS